MEMLYNPDNMDEAELRASFVARRKLMEDMIEIIKRQPEGAGVQHIVIKGPRGMGKTTVLLMLRLLLRDHGLDKKWQAVKFPEESYGINDLTDLWLQVIDLLSEETRDGSIKEKIKGMKEEFRDSDELGESALALIRDWSKERNKRLLLLIDNFDMIFEQINDERENARLRDVLMNEGLFMIVGGALTFFEEARAYDQPLYNFFKIYDLQGLKFEEVKELLRKRAEWDMIPDFENLLLSNEGRLRALEYFTGGNPRLSLMLYKIITQSDISEVKKALEKLLDEVTPYYKAKTESLPAQQRKILDHIAKISGQTGEGLTPGEIAVSIRLSPNLVSSQLKRLSEVGYVRCANLRGRRKFYALSEPLYSIWYQMRMGKNAKERLGWLINFLKLWYSPGEVIKEFERLFTIFHEHLNKESWIKARDVLEHGEYLVDAVKETPEYYKISDQIKTGKSETEEKATIEYDKGCKALEDDKFDEALTFFTDAIDIKPDFYMAWLKKGNAFLSLGKINDAIRSYDRAQGLFLNFEHAFENACSMLQINHEEGVKNIIKAFEVYPEELAKRYLDILDAFPKNKIPWKTRMQSYLLLYIFHIIQGDLNQAKKDIVEAQESKNYIDPSEYINNLIPSLIVSFILKNDMMNRLILSMELSGEGFPLFRAIDYFIKGDKALIEKLNPEIKKIVLEITEQLKETSGEKRKHEIKPQKRKPKYQLRHRTRKQL